MLKVDNNTFIFSDPHYGHRNLVKGVSSWKHKRQCRDFDTVDEHNTTIVNRINEKVPENATAICLGDWSFGGKENIWEFRKRINCNDIHLILGNHDHHIENDKTINIPSTEIKRFNEIAGRRVREPQENYREKIHKLFSSVSHYKQMRFKRNGNIYHFVLSHYAMRVWDKAHYGSIMLYGHSHGTLDKMTPKIANPTWVGDKYYIRNYRTMDVGLDTNNFYPYHIEEIVDMMKDRPVGIEIDHHN